MKKLLFLLLLPLSLLAQLPKELSPLSHVNDYMDVLSHDQMSSLAEKIFFIERTCHVSIRILLIKSLAGTPIESLTTTIGNEWHVGDNGIIYVASVRDRKQRIATSKNMRDFLNDNQRKEIIDATTAHFKSGHYYEGLYAMLSVLQISVQASLTKEDANNCWYSFWSLLGVVLIGVLLTVYIRKKRRDKAVTEYYSPELSTNTDHIPYPHRLKQQAESRRAFNNMRVVAQQDTQADDSLNTLTNLVVMEEIIDSNNIPSYDPGPSVDNSSCDYSSSDSDNSSNSSDSSSSSSDYSSSDSSSSSFDGGGGSSGDF